MNYLSCKEVASILRCNVTCVYSLIHTGDIPSTKRGRNYLIHSADLDDYLGRGVTNLSTPFKTSKTVHLNRDEHEVIDMFLDSIRDMLNNGKIIAVDINAPPVTTVYQDEDFYYFDPDEIYKEVKRYYAKAGEPFNISKAHLYQLLVTNGIVEGEVDRTTKAKCLNGSRPRKLWVKADAVHNVCEVDEDDEEAISIPNWLEELKETIKAEILAELGFGKKKGRR